MNEDTPGTILLGVVITLLVLAIMSNVQCHMGLHSTPKQYELKEEAPEDPQGEIVEQEAPEDPQWEIVEQDGMLMLLDPNGMLICEWEI